MPAPATAFILKDVPVYSGNINGELCTPTGVALLKHFAGSYSNLPFIRTKAIGYGMGKNDFPADNCVRAILGETEDNIDIISELSCNVEFRRKVSSGYGIVRSKCEYDDLLRIAKEQNMSLDEVRNLIKDN